MTSDRIDFGALVKASVDEEISDFSLDESKIRTFESSNRGENLRDTDEDIASRLRPYVEIYERLLLASRGVVSADTQFVNVGLDDGSPDHGAGGGSESERNLLDGSEFDVESSEEGVDDEVEDGDEDDERERVDWLS